MKRLLVTGSAGFVGSHIVEYMQPFYEVVGFDRGDDLADIDRVDYIIHAAADADVADSLRRPVPTILNNVGVSLSLLEWAREVQPSIFIQISTNEVYGPGVHAEWDAMVPGSPYAASKVAQEAIAIAYWRSYGLPLVIVNTQNLFGEHQQRDRFIPVCVRKILAGESMPLVDAKRPWLYVRDLADALHFLLKLGAPPFAFRPERYHVRGIRERENVELAWTIATALGRPLVSEMVQGRPEHKDHLLAGNTLASLGWHPPTDVKQAIEQVALWWALELISAA